MITPNDIYQIVSALKAIDMSLMLIFVALCFRCCG